MGIETTWMRKGHGPDGIIGSTNQPDTVRTFAYSYHDCISITLGKYRWFCMHSQMLYYNSVC